MVGEGSPNYVTVVKYINLAVRRQVDYCNYQYRNKNSWEELHGQGPAKRIRYRASP